MSQPLILQDDTSVVELARIVWKKDDSFPTDVFILHCCQQHNPEGGSLVC